MAPEVASRDWHSYPADIWSIGCLVIEMASGKPPWSNYSNLSREVIKLIKKPNNLPDLPNVSEELTDFTLQCLSRDPSNRPTASELLKHDFIQHESAAKCYDNIRASTNALSVKASINDVVWDKKTL